MENIQQINEENNKNILEGTLLDNILQQHNVGIVINEKVYADRKKADGRDDWVKKRDTIVSNLQHEINYFNLKDEEKNDNGSELLGFGIMAAGASLLFVSRRLRK